VSYLREDKNETLLVVINIGNKPVTDYQLELGRGTLSGKYAAASLLDDSTISALQANETGGFDAYTPLAEMPPYGVLVIQLTPQK
jgi:hypothetical protein